MHLPKEEAMANILDYIKWRGDITFDVAGFNEVDNLIFSKLAYLNFNGIVDASEEGGIPIENAVEIYFQENRLVDRIPGDFYDDNFEEFLQLLGNSRRFQNLRIKKYVQKRDEELGIQFSAMTVGLGDNSMYVSYRGTDDTLVGWKEDFMMSFMEVVPAQEEALNYLTWIGALYRYDKFYIGGHSKGGNLAVYSAIHAPKAVQQRILLVYNNDGPGFKNEIIHHIGYQRIQDRIVTLVPQSSVVGMLMEHEEHYEVVSSVQTGIMQHDGFSWEVQRDQFLHLDAVTKESHRLDLTLKRFLEGLETEKREEFVHALFDVLSNREYKTLSDIKNGGLKSLVSMVKTYEGLDKSTKQMFHHALKQLIQEGIRTVREEK